MRNVIMLGLVLFIACHQREINKTNLQHSVLEIEPKIELEGLQAKNSIIEGTIGVLTYNTKISQSVEVNFFNDNGTLCDGLEDNFNPYSWHPDYGVLALRCIEANNDTCKVIVNEEFKIVKNYPLKNKGLIFQTWEEHILSVFSVGFDEKANPLRKLPSKDATTINYNPDEFYLPYKINGDWLQVRWGSEGDWDYGWIMWRKDGTLLIELFYFA